jgi:hypothetical protein
MKLSRHQFLHLAAGAAALPALSRIARGQTYPTRPVHTIVGYMFQRARRSRAAGSAEHVQQDTRESLMIATRTGLFALAFAAMIAGSSLAAQLEPSRKGQESFIHRAIFADGRLWLLSDAGLLSSIADGEDNRVEAMLPEPALDLWSQGGQPAVITCRRDRCTDWTLRERIDGRWTVMAKVSTEGDRFVAIGRTATMVTLLTSRRIIEIAGGNQSATALSRPLRAGPITSVHIAPSGIFVGVNAGEWGGGLQRVDRQTGEVSTIERNTSGQLCGGPLNTECDPVNGIAAEPWKPECVAVAVGLVHFTPHGRIVELCQDVVRRLYFKPYGRQPPENDETRKRDEPFSTVAFFGLMRQAHTLWAVGIDGIYQIGPEGAMRSTPLPTFKQVGGLFVSFDLADIVLVLTDTNQRLSISGSVPILVAR